MNFGANPIPQRLFDLARERLLGHATSTAEQVREHILKNGQVELQQVNALTHNHRIIADRVYQSVRQQLAEAGEIEPIKRGVWATAAFMRAAAADEARHRAQS